MYRFVYLIFAFACSGSVSAQWRQTGGPTGGLITSFTKGPNYVLACSGTGKVFYSSDSGKSWIERSNGLVADASCILLVGTKLLAGTSSGIYISTDDGANWAHVSSALDVEETNVLISGGSRLYAGTANGIYISTDNGSTWLKGGA